MRERKNEYKERKNEYKRTKENQHTKISYVLNIHIVYVNSLLHTLHLVQTSGLDCGVSDWIVPRGPDWTDIQWSLYHVHNDTKHPSQSTSEFMH